MIQGLFVKVLLSVLLFLSIESSAYSQGFSAGPFKGELNSSTSNKRVLLIESNDTTEKYRISDIEKLPLVELQLPAVWKREAGLYQGVLLRDLLSVSGNEEAEQVKLVALDGYVIEINLPEWNSSCLFIATRFEREEIVVEKKGPTRLLLPCTIKGEAPEYEETTTSEWIWNLKEIRILK